VKIIFFKQPKAYSAICCEFDLVFLLLDLSMMSQVFHSYLFKLWFPRSNIPCESTWLFGRRRMYN